MRRRCRRVEASDAIWPIDRPTRRSSRRSRLRRDFPRALVRSARLRLIVRLHERRWPARSSFCCRTHSWQHLVFVPNGFGRLGQFASKPEPACSCCFLAFLFQVAVARPNDRQLAAYSLGPMGEVQCNLTLRSSRRSRLRRACPRAHSCASARLSLVVGWRNMYEHSIIRRTGQWWKALGAYISAVASGLIMFWGLYQQNIFLPAVFSGMAIMFGGFVFGAVAIRCPLCRTKWAWLAVRTQNVGQWLPWLLNQQRCPVCQVATQPAAGADDARLPRADRR